MFLFLNPRIRFLRFKSLKYIEIFVHGNWVQILLRHVQISRQGPEFGMQSNYGRSREIGFTRQAEDFLLHKSFAFDLRQVKCGMQ